MGYFNETLWLPLMTVDDIWWPLMTVDDRWWLLMTVDDCWWPLKTFDDRWWPLMTCDDLWHGNDGNGIALWQFQLSLVISHNNNIAPNFGLGKTWFKFKGPFLNKQGHLSKTRNSLKIIQFANLNCQKPIVLMYGVMMNIITTWSNGFQASI